MQIYFLSMLVEAATILAAFSLVSGILLDDDQSEYAFMLAKLIIPNYFTIALYQGAYSITALQNISASISRSGVALLVSSLLVQIFITNADIGGVAGAEHGLLSAISLAFAYLLIVLWRGLLNQTIRRNGVRVMNLLIIDDGGPAITRNLAHRVNARAQGLDPTRSDPQSLNRIGEAFRNMDRVIISCAQERKAAWTILMRNAGVYGEVVYDELASLDALALHRNGAFNSLVVSSGPLGVRSRLLKRLFDIAVAGMAAITLAPLLLLTALAIKLEDGGPVIFMQKRIGRGNRMFNIYKFRSMKVDRLDFDGTQSATQADSRITLVGRFIRRTSIDELPQIFNVLLGDMSIVGPRPHALGSVVGQKLFWEVDDSYWARHSLRPGLTGLAQVRGFRGGTEAESDLTNRIKADLEYIKDWTLWRDVTITVKTASVLVHPNAY